jgi:hypothetical protein
MKKFLLMAVAAMMATMSVSAQHREGDNVIQPRVGVTFSTLTDTEDAKMKVNLAYGVEFEYFVTEEFSVAGGALFTDQGTKFDNGKLDLYYALLPITANYYVLPGLAVKAGLQPAFRVKARAEIDGVKIDYDRMAEMIYQDVDVKMNKFDLSLPIGLSYEFNGITLDARYNFGITELFRNVDDHVRNQVIAVTLGYKL